MTDLYELNEYANHGYDVTVTPTTEAIRATYATDYYMIDVRGGVTEEQRADAFDRWLAEHDRQVAERVWDECATKVHSWTGLVLAHTYRTEEESND